MAFWNALWESAFPVGSAPYIVTTFRKTFQSAPFEINGDTPLWVICSYQKLDAGLWVRRHIPAKSGFAIGGRMPDPAGRFQGCFVASIGI